MCPVGDDQQKTDGGRDETEEERLDRKWDDLLQELRVMQTGVQLLAGFLLTLPFQGPFADLDDLQRRLYLALVVIAALTTAMVMAPIAVHRRLSGLHVKERLVVTAHAMVAGVLTGIALLITGMVVFIFDVVVDRSIALSMGGGVALVLLALLVVLPNTLLGRHD
ncbi:MAG: hypothetical protein JWN22_3394 [Nocardioides sp.]|jgi:hypothetical protein|nr:hypothetical protein [Nocardioides sp.]